VERSPTNHQPPTTNSFYVVVVAGGVSLIVVVVGSAGGVTGWVGAAVPLAPLEGSGSALPNPCADGVWAFESAGLVMAGGAFW
jgi:hypothetical protein